jgi:acetoin utilization deacetylase AcuC-like enzyme
MTMKTFFNHLHAQHQGQFEMFRGALVPCHEVPARADHVLAELQRRKLGEVCAPQAVNAGALGTIHSQRYLTFLQNAWSEWVALDPANATRDALPSVWPTRTLRSDVLPDSFAARMGLFSYDAGSPLTSGTWVAARAGADRSRRRARRLFAQPPTRPPRRCGLLWRLLLFEQRRPGGPASA